jgi:soluble lytic murein transglycosylase-like protein
MRPAISCLIITFVLVTLSENMWATDIYGYDDCDGIAHFSNVPDSARYHLVLSTTDDAKDQPDARYSPRERQMHRTDSKPSPYTQTILKEAQANRLDPMLVDAVITVESNQNPNARSSTGAVGLMQLMPGTAKRYGVANPYHAESNIRGGTRYLRDLVTMFDGDLNLVLAAYNAGENAVLRHGKRIPPYSETKAYVPKVMSRYAELQRTRAQ